MKDRLKAGFIGLGAMGAGMADHLHRAGMLTAVWNRTAERAQAFAAGRDVVVAESAQALAALCNVIVTCVSTDDDLFEVITALLETAVPGSLVIDTSTVSVDTAIGVRDLLAKKQCGFVDAPVSGGVEGARNGQLVVMAGGSEADFIRARPVLEVFARLVAHMGKTGSGQATKAVNQVMAAGINQAVTEALAFGERQGLDMQQVVSLLADGAAGNWFLKHRGSSMLEDSFEPGFKLALHYKDLRICQQMAGGEGCLPLVDDTLEDYRLLLEQGFGDMDISVLFRSKRD